MSNTTATVAGVEVSTEHWIGGQRAGFAVHRLDAEPIGSVWDGRIVAPQETLHWKLVGVERRRL